MLHHKKKAAIHHNIPTSRHKHNKGGTTEVGVVVAWEELKTRPDRQTDKQPNKQRLRCRETITAWFRSPRRCHSPACDWLSCLDFVERTMMVCVIGPVACIHCSHPDWLSLTLLPPLPTWCVYLTLQCRTHRAYLSACPPSHVRVACQPHTDQTCPKSPGIPDIRTGTGRAWRDS